MNFGRTLLQEFRMQLTMASEPDISVFNIRARLCTAVHQTDAYARAIQPLMERRGVRRLSRCQLCGVYGHEASANNVRDVTGGRYSQRGRPSRNGEGPLAASYESERRQLHSFHHLPPFGKDVAPHRRHSTRYYKWLNAMVEKGNGAYLLTTLECGTTNRRHPRFGPVI
ncbi:selenocysteine-tRNA-specific elongation factor [Trypanosoma cruzi]|nr:selenocysteine-tRNA-specific elongation factor [Trypanosoma cruzi]